MHPEFVASIKVIINIIMMTCASLRFYVMHIKQNRRSYYDLFSHILLFSAIWADNGSCGLSVWILMREIKDINKYGMAAANNMVGGYLNLKLLFTANVMYYSSLCLIKLAYLVFYYQLFDKITGRRRILMYVASAIWLVAYVVGFMFIFIWCGPFDDNFRTPADNPRCPGTFSLPAFGVLAAMNLWSDFAIAAVPLILMGSLNLTRTTRNAYLFVFGFGSISIVASVARLIVVTLRLKKHVMDWDSIHVNMLWNHAEIFFGVFAFMLPSFRFILLKGAHLFSRSRRSGSSGSSQGKFANANGNATIGSPFRRPKADTATDWTLETKRSVADADEERLVHVVSASIHGHNGPESPVSTSTAHDPSSPKLPHEPQHYC